MKDKLILKLSKASLLLNELAADIGDWYPEAASDIQRYAADLRSLRTFVDHTPESHIKSGKQLRKVISS